MPKAKPLKRQAEKKANSDFVTPTEFARRLDVDIEGVRVALKRGRIVADENGKIHFPTQSIAWEQNRDFTRLSAKTLDKMAGNNAVDDGKPTIMSVKMEKELWTAKLQKLKYLHESGELLEKDKVKSAMFRFSRTVRNSVVSIPDRVCATVAAKIKSESDKKNRPLTEREVEHILRIEWNREITDTLENLDAGPKMPDVSI